MASRMERILAQLHRFEPQIIESKKGSVNIDFAGPILVVRLTQIVEDSDSPDSSGVKSKASPSYTAPGRTRER